MALTGYPDGQPTARPNQFATALVGSTSTGSLAQAFGFGAGLMKAVIDSGGPAYMQLNGNAATTNDYKLTSSDLMTDWYNIGVPFSGIAICQGTSTALSMRIGAWG